mgnify:CR=1 FL=1
MSDYAVLGDLLVIFAVSTVVVFIFHQFRLPSIAGFLVAGALIGPHGLHLIPDASQVQALAEIGIVLLLFTIGIEFSSVHFATAKRILAVAAPAQVGGVLILALLVALAAGLSYQQGIFWGFLLSLSSTAIVLKALSERGDSDSYHGHATVAILIFQDLAVVAMMLITPILATPTGSALGAVLLTLVKAGVVVGLIVAAAWYIVPPLLQHIVRSRSRELFLLSIIVLCLGIAWLTSLGGLSLALGAFIAGLVIAESEYSHQALAEVLPFRDSFNSLFFVSIGVLMDPRVVLNHPFVVAGLLVAVILGKFLTGAAAMLAALPEPDRLQLVQAMGTIQRLLAPADAPAPTRTAILREHQPGDIGWVIQQHGEIYAREYGWNSEFEALVAGIGAEFLKKFDPAYERCWVAELDGARVGSVFVVRKSATVAQLRMLILTPSARGLGLGARLTDECIAFARSKGYRKLVLWTNSILTVARDIYARRGFTLVTSEPYNAFGHDLVSETWELRLQG